ncbi:RNA polymerase sigma-70 factor [Anseongella ginsenosidimutans]|nr:RNA polymerase sigma-70 factor [Anseongella ginsenosidimutans]
MCSDAELAEFLRSGDPVAFAEVYDRYNTVLLAHAFRKLENREEARDIVQETFSLVWQRREHLDPGSNLSGYLFTTVRNLVLNCFAHRKVKDKYHLSMEQFAAAYGKSQEAADHLIREKQLADAIGREIEELPARMRNVFKLSRREHLDHKEIASRLRISEQTVSSHITHALKILRTRLSTLLLFFFLLFS